MSAHPDAKPMASQMPPGETWILVANQSQARIFRYLGLKSGLKLVEKIQHPEGRLKDHELGADRPGRTESSVSWGRSSYSEEHPPHEEMAWEFARRLTRRLQEARGRNEFRALMLVAEAGFMGKLKSTLDAQTAKVVVGTLPKAFHQKSSRELSQQIERFLLSG